MAAMYTHVCLPAEEKPPYDHVHSCMLTCRGEATLRSQRAANIPKRMPTPRSDTGRMLHETVRERGDRHGPLWCGTERSDSHSCGDGGKNLAVYSIVGPR